MITTAWAVWLGSMVFFSFVVAPTVHGSLEREQAVTAIRALFPRYYMTGIVAGAVALTVCLTVGADLRLTLPLAACWIASLYARQRILPAANEARERGDDDAFARLHVFSVRLNMVVLALLLLVGTLLALRTPAAALA